MTDIPRDEHSTDIPPQQQQLSLLPDDGHDPAVRLGAGLSDHEREMLIRLIQEAGEVVQSATKMLLFGRTATDMRTSVAYDNVEGLGLEVGDLQQMVSEVAMLGLVRERDITEGMDRKRMNLGIYLRTVRP